MIVLRIVLKDLRPLLIVKGANELFDTDTPILLPPLFAVDEPTQTINYTIQHSFRTGDSHLLRKLDIELPRAEEP